MKYIKENTIKSSSSSSSQEERGREKIIERIESVFSYLAKQLRERSNNYEDQLYEVYLPSIEDENNDDDDDDSIVRKSSNFLYINYYQQFGLNTDFYFYIKNYVLPYKFQGFDSLVYKPNISTVDKNWIMFTSTSTSTSTGIRVGLEQLTTTSLIRVVELLTGVPEISSFLNKDIFKKINKQTNN